MANSHTFGTSVICLPGITTSIRLFHYLVSCVTTRPSGTSRVIPSFIPPSEEYVKVCTFIMSERRRNIELILHMTHISRDHQNDHDQSLEERCTWTFAAKFFRRFLDRTLNFDKVSAKRATFRISFLVVREVKRIFDATCACFLFTLRHFE